METRNHQHPDVRDNGVLFDDTSLCLGQGGRSAQSRVSSSSRSVYFPSSISQATGDLSTTPESQDVRDDVALPPAVRSTHMVRGLSEMTNRLEQRFAGDTRRLWGARRYNDYTPKHLPASAYTERFRSLTNASSRYEHPYTSARPDSYGPTYWRDREELARQQELTRRNIVSKHHFLSKKHAHSSHLSASKFRAQGSPPSNANPSTSKPLENPAYASQLMNSKNLPASAALQDRGYGRLDVEIKESSSGMRSAVIEKRLETLNHDSLHKRGYGMVQADPEIRKDSVAKKSKSGMLDILCSATLELGPIQANPTTGCSCPRSNCIKLYCDCFKAGRPCSGICSCLNCKNTEEETSVNGERIQAIKNTLARNPRAFTGGKKEAVPQNPGDIVCNCLKSRCLKLYCHCFHKGRTCNDACLCIACLNTSAENNVGGKRNLAIQNCLEKRPDAFTKKPKEVGAGCACKNNKCLKKYW